MANSPDRSRTTFDEVKPIPLGRIVDHVSVLVDRSSASRSAPSTSGRPPCSCSCGAAGSRCRRAAPGTGRPRSGPGTPRRFRPEARACKGRSPRSRRALPGTRRRTSAGPGPTLARASVPSRRAPGRDPPGRCRSPASAIRRGRRPGRRVRVGPDRDQVRGLMAHPAPLRRSVRHRRRPWLLAITAFRDVPSTRCRPGGSPRTPGLRRPRVPRWPASRPLSLRAEPRGRP